MTNAAPVAAAKPTSVMSSARPFPVIFAATVDNGWQSGRANGDIYYAIAPGPAKLSLIGTASGACQRAVSPVRGQARQGGEDSGISRDVSAARELRRALIEEGLHTFAEILAIDAILLNRAFFPDGTGEIQCVRATKQPLRARQS